jgi:hypothetical protein
MNNCWANNCEEEAKVDGYCEKHHRQRQKHEAQDKVRDKVREALETLKQVASDRELHGVFAVEVNRMHRTEQQLVMGTVMEMLQHWADQCANGTGYYDARNEDTVTMAYEMLGYLRKVRPNNFMMDRDGAYRWHLAYI